jgi:hypothetical protein
MNTVSPALFPLRHFAFEPWMKIVRTGVAAALLATPAMADTIWNQTGDQTWPPTKLWSEPTNWTAGVPDAEDANTYINLGTVLIDTEVGTIQRLHVQGSTTVTGTSGVWIASGGKLTLETVGSNTGILYVRTGRKSDQRVMVESGGTLNVSGISMSRSGSATEGTSLFTNWGAISVSGNATVETDKARFEMKGGSMSVGGSLTVGATSTPLDGAFYSQTGGVLNVTSNLELQPGAVVEVSGGSITGSNWLYFNQGAADRAGTTFHVLGSGATSIQFSSLKYANPSSGDNATWAFTIDNGPEHITTVKFVSALQDGNKLRAGTLDVDLSGGVLLSGTDTLTLFDAPVISAGTNFLNAADYAGGIDGGLWEQSIVDGVTDELRITLNGNKNQGLLEATLNDAISFDPASFGYVELVNVGLDEPLVLALDVTGGTLSNFTNALTAAGIIWQAGTGDYEVNLVLDPAVSGGNYFAWDFASVDANMTLQGLMIVPEPTAVVLVIGGLGTFLLRRRRVVR